MRAADSYTVFKTAGHWPIIFSRLTQSISYQV